MDEFKVGDRVIVVDNEGMFVYLGETAHIGSKGQYYSMGHEFLDIIFDYPTNQANGGYLLHHFELYEPKMKFKVGDYVQCVYNDSQSMAYVGNRGYITSVDESDDYPYEVDFADGCSFSDGELSLAGTPSSIYTATTFEGPYTNQIEEDLRKLSK